MRPIPNPYCANFPTQNPLVYVLLMLFHNFSRLLFEDRQLFATKTTAEYRSFHFGTGDYFLETRSKVRTFSVRKLNVIIMK